MDLLSFLRGLSHDGLQPGDTIVILNDSGDTVEATYKGKHAGGRVVVTYTQGRYTGMGQYVERERIVGPVGKKAEPGLAHYRGWDQMKEVREQITAAALFTLLVIGPASFYAGIVLVTSANRAIASLVFLVAVVTGLPTAARWVGKRTARRKQGTTNPIPEAQMTVHGFIAHIKMHPELLPPGMTEFDLECFRKLCSGTSQAGIDHWVEQCSRRIHEQQS